ncbi:hypothetical protein C8250_017295 [Streptomyces sp. So13.3]|uniref:DUF3592 domain-containing protein n=1 Tax=Streptomyces sp. So13.3 TaxID=2136173 RepID=UPI0011064193|nr:DUF3592 domain-containing protein [Streptomyces sp. So13.3]QNA73438.1 hypothetical protein C8250_017295 [Streptomyces sp. So13.3]
MLILPFLAGPLFLALGLVLGIDNGTARLHFSDAQKVSAVVTSAEYVKPQFKQSASRVRVALLVDGRQVVASIDDVASAPDGLSAGDSVIVLADQARSGHALFPSQLGWEKMALPGGFIGAGLFTSIAAGVSASRAVRTRHGR